MRAGAVRSPCTREQPHLASVARPDVGVAAYARLVVPSLGACGRRSRAVSLGCAVAAPERHQHQNQPIQSPATGGQHSSQLGPELGWRTDFSSQYSMLEVLGKGNFGVVWLAASRHDPVHQVAVKVLPKCRQDRPREETLACIKREVALWGSLSGDSRFVAQLLGLYEDDSSAYLVQQRCFGDLTTAMQHGPLPEPCAAAIMWCVLSAIRDCHSHHLAMVDVKPQNFLLTAAAPQAAAQAAPEAEGRAEADGAQAGRNPFTGLRLLDQMLGASPQGAPQAPCVVACDFGCSLSYSELMRGGRHGGSPIFFAPEQFSTSYGLGVDVWAAGVMLYLLLSGRYPFWDCKREDVKPGMKAYEVMLAVCSAPIQFLSPEWRSVSRDARDLVTRMLDRNPATRLTAEEALQHHWFVRWMAPPSATAKPAPGQQPQAKQHKPSAARAKEPQQQQQHEQEQLTAAMAASLQRCVSAGGAPVITDDGSGASGGDMAASLRGGSSSASSAPACSATTAATAAAPSQPWCLGGSNIVPAPAHAAVGAVAAGNSGSSGSSSCGSAASNSSSGSSGGGESGSNIDPVNGVSPSHQQRQQQQQ